ncbi:MAG: hypothetical protein GX416_14000 [Bacteroidales bacterium]|nr:hypothetical protein [Bacteroidales bacterium]
MAKNVIRPFILCRKNFLFCGNHKSAENIAIICSLLASCKEDGVNSKERFNDVVAKLSYYLKPKSGKSLKELIPHLWKESTDSKESQ